MSDVLLVVASLLGSAKVKICPWYVQPGKLMTQT